jgi:NAD(P)-dependent dehydrogenase (short-subunit alcohol dehydrogenase family)
LFLHGHVCLLSDRKSEGRGDNDHERAAIHHAKILRLFGRHVERLEQAFREGASVAVVDVDEAGVHAVVKEITANGGKAKGIVADLREDANARRIVRETANAFGGLDFVWNHLGHPGPASVDGIEMADFALAVDLDLRSQIVATEAALPELRARSGGSLLYTVSTSGLVGSQFSPVYSAVKFGVVGFVRALAKRVAKDKIRVNAICPGATDTPMLRVFVARPDRQSTQGMDKEQLVARRAGQNPMGRQARPAEIANAALFLLSDEASFITGAHHRRGAAGRRRHDGVKPPLSDGYGVDILMFLSPGGGEASP